MTPVFRATLSCALLAVLASCHHRVGTPSPRIEEGSPVLGEPLGVQVELPAQPAPPKDAGSACIASLEADRVEKELKAYTDAMELQETAKRGWLPLTEFTVFEFEHVDPDRLLPRGDVRMQTSGRDRFVDQDGNEWLALEDSGGCGPLRTRFYIDQRNNVFPVSRAPTCEATVEMTVCGSWPVDGCGVAPRYERRLFAKVPRGARLIAQPAPITLGPITCYRFHPEEGYSYPP
jgi:hypothetical protein